MASGGREDRIGRSAAILHSPPYNDNNYSELSGPGRDGVAQTHTLIDGLERFSSFENR
jgi:hypothetical protein